MPNNQPQRFFFFLFCSLHTYIFIGMLVEICTPTRIHNLNLKFAFVCHVRSIIFFNCAGVCSVLQEIPWKLWKLWWNCRISSGDLGHMEAIKVRKKLEFDLLCFRTLGALVSTLSIAQMDVLSRLLAQQDEIYFAFG